MRGMFEMDILSEAISVIKKQRIIAETGNSSCIE